MVYLKLLFELRMHDNHGLLDAYCLDTHITSYNIIPYQRVNQTLVPLP